MKTWIALVTAVGLLSVGCQRADRAQSFSPDNEGLSASEFKQVEAAEPRMLPSVSAGDAADPDAPRVSPGEAQGRQIAYAYAFGIAVPTGQMEELLDAHRGACEAAGPEQCFVVSSSITGLGEDYANGSLELRASSGWVSGFRSGLEDGLEPFDAKLDSSQTSSEDLTVQIIDTSVRLETNRSLRSRLQGLLRDRPGKLGDLLEIERELARVQAEIDSTQSVLNAMRARVSMSSLTLSYQPRFSPVSGSVWRPLAEAVSGIIPSLVVSLAGVVTFIAGALPWVIALGVLAWGGWALLGRLRRRNRKQAPASGGGTTRSF